MADAYFVDTSALCKRYVLEIGSGWLRTTIDPATGCGVTIVRTTAVEMIAAISRRERQGSIAPAAASMAKADFRADLASVYRIIDISPSLTDRAMNLADKHAIRGFDAIQLAGVLEVNSLRIAGGLSAITLLASDSDLNTAATAEGLAVDDPNNHP